MGNGLLQRKSAAMREWPKISVATTVFNEEEVLPELYRRVSNVLSTLRELVKGRLIAVFGCGGNRDASKRPAMGRVAAELADESIVTSDNPRREDPAAIIDQIKEGFPAGSKVDAIEDRREAIAAALARAGAGDIVLIAGKGHETFQEFANRTVPFDDRDVARRALAGEG